MVEPNPFRALAPEDLPIVDAREQFLRASAQSAADDGFDRAFISSKMELVRPRIRRYARRDRVFRDELERDSSTDWSRPQPGSVAFGVFYEDAFRASWATGTDLYWEALCPLVPGGNVSTFLYVTAMNRASKGCEALLRYHAQEHARFKVFDWSLDQLPSERRWMVDRPLSAMDQYIKTGTVEGRPISTLPMRNLTFFGGGTSWTNQVLLQNQASGGWELVYASTYNSQLAILQSSEVGTWSPILETFQNSYAGTQAFGSLNTQLRSCSSGGVWSGWQSLSSDQSGFWAEGLGFSPILLQPNSTWAVRS